MRPGISWVIPGAVVAVGLFAGLDALRSAGGEPTSSGASATVVATAQADTGAQVESSASMIDEQLVKLVPGRVRTDTDYRGFDSFTVPPGWYGHQRGASYVIGNELKDQAVTWRSGGISVEPIANRFSRSLADAAGAFEKLREIRIEHVSPVRIGGNSGRRYDFVVDGSLSLRPLGANATLWPGQADVILLDVPGGDTNTLIIRWGFDDDPERAEVERVLMSLEFDRPPPPKKEIERLGNRWARLFGAGRRCNQHMGQPLCERIDCERASGRPIPNCTPVSSEVQRSFAGAVVREIVVRGQRAAARFSNGETVRFTKSLADQVWFIERVGAGGKLFE
jgi:hypothetical protein